LLPAEKSGPSIETGLIAAELHSAKATDLQTSCRSLAEPRLEQACREAKDRRLLERTAEVLHFESGSISRGKRESAGTSGAVEAETREFGGGETAAVQHLASL